MNSRSGPVRTSDRSAARGSAGFTLIELMVVVAVVAILASIALPAYQDSVRKGYRGQAKADLVEIAQQAERFRTVNNTYTGFAVANDQSPSTGTARYVLAVDVDDGGREFLATAVPVSGSSQAQDRCGTLSINQAGSKRHATGTDAECGFGTLAPPPSP